MRVLFFNEYTTIYGGTDIVVDTELQRLIESGIDVKSYTIHNKAIINLNLWERAVLYYKSCTGTNHIKAFQKLIFEFKPHIIHFHNIYQLFRAPLWGQIKPNGAKIVLHIHNFYPFCLNSRMFRKKQCMDCFNKNSWWPGILHRCYKNSFLYSLLFSINRISPHDWIRKANRLFKIIVVSQFLYNEYKKLGLSDKILEVLANSTNFYSKASADNYILFLGNIIKPKGIKLFCEVAKQLPHLQFIVAGEGADSRIMKNKFQSLSNLIFLGFLSGERKNNLLKECRFLYSPVICNETFGITILEAFSFGKPVLTTGFGAIQELVIHGFTGRINSNLDLCSQVKSVNDFWNELSINNSYSENCLQLCEEYSTERHIKKLINIYCGNN